jgi:hypothetical protein
MYKAIIFLALVCAALAQNIRQGSAGADVVVSGQTESKYIQKNLHNI